MNFEAYWLEYSQETSEGYYDDNGDYQPGEKEWRSYGRVNAQPMTGPTSITLPDGHTDTYSFTIHIHNPRCMDFRHGQKIRLTTPSGDKFILTVKGKARYQTKYIIQA